MAVKYVSGDLFVNRFGAEAFAHGCNLQGSMGAGIAKVFRERYPEMYAEYRRRCRAEPRRFNLGDSFFWRAHDQPSVFNLGTQERYWRARASYEGIATALESMQRQADEMVTEPSQFLRSALDTGASHGKRFAPLLSRSLPIGQEHSMFTRSTFPINERFPQRRAFFPIRTE